MGVIDHRMSGMYTAVKGGRLVLSFAEPGVYYQLLMREQEMPEMRYAGAAMNQWKNPPSEDSGTSASKPVILSDPKLAACRDIALQLLIQSFDGFFNHLEAEFLELADNAIDRNLRDTYFSARVETQTKRELIKSEFRQRFLDAFNDRMKEISTGKRRVQQVKVEISAGELSLVANDEYEENLAASSIANNFKRSSADDFKEVESRLASLIPRNDNEEMPDLISPEAICEAMVCACRQIESGVDARIVALRAFEGQLANQVAAVYRQVNEFLTQQNVQPVSYKLRPRSLSGQDRSFQNESAGNAFAEPARQAGYENAPPTAQSQGDAPAGMVNVMVPAALASHLEMLLSGQAPTMPASPPARLTNQVSFLDQLQHRLPDDPVAIEGVNMHPARDNLVSLLQSTQWAENLAQVDAMTLNLVALLFDRLFEDSRLPDAIKGLIGRLQIPVLKVALVDNTFFARKNHPSRQLLDRLAEAGVDWQDGAETGNPRFDKLSAIVSWVVVNFEDDVGIFEQALSDLESFLLAEADAAASQVLEDTEELAASEINELGMATADSLVKSRMFRREVPPLVSEFVHQWWIPAVAKAYGPAGENEPRFMMYSAALDDLLWSVEPKKGPEERLLLVNRLPGMLKTLEDGAELAGMPAEQCKSFFSELVHCHAAAIRNGMRAAPPAAVSVQADVAKAMAEADAAEQPVAAPAPTPVFEVPQMQADEIPARWEWISLHKDDGSVHKLRLTWVSPQQTRFLFTNRDGENGHTFTRAELERLMRSGRVQREMLSGSLTDEVFDQLRQALVS